LIITTDGKVTGSATLQSPGNDGRPSKNFAIEGEYYLDYVYMRVVGRDAMIIGDVSSSATSSVYDNLHNM
jgi:hypothetical protein